MLVLDNFEVFLVDARTGKDVEHLEQIDEEGEETSSKVTVVSTKVPLPGSSRRELELYWRKIQPASRTYFCKVSSITPGTGRYAKEFQVLMQPWALSESTKGCYVRRPFGVIGKPDKGLGSLELDIRGRSDDDERDELSAFPRNETSDSSSSHLKFRFDFIAQRGSSRFDGEPTRSMTCSVESNASRARSKAAALPSGLAGAAVSAPIKQEQSGREFFKSISQPVGTMPSDSQSTVPSSSCSAAPLLSQAVSTESSRSQESCGRVVPLRPVDQNRLKRKRKQLEEMEAELNVEKERQLDLKICYMELEINGTRKENMEMEKKIRLSRAIQSNQAKDRMP